MNTNPSDEDRDSLSNRDCITTEVNGETVKKVDQNVPGQPMDNTLDLSEANFNHLTSQNISPENITECASDNSDGDDSTKDCQLNQGEIPTIPPPSVNYQGSITKSFSEIKSMSTVEQLRPALLEIVDHLVSLQERVAKLEESAKFKFDTLVQDALKQDDAIWDEDNKECQKYIEQAKLWHSKTEELYTSVVTAITDCGSRIDQCGDLMQEINKESSTLHKSLLNRYESLEISKRMLERLREPIELLKKTLLPSEQLLRLQEQDLVDLLRSRNDEAEAEKALAKKLKETSNTRYKSVREWRDLSEKLQRQWLNFIEKKLLPVLDGINDGKLHAEHLVNDLKHSYQTQDYQEKLSAWLQTYVEVENILVDSLESLDVNQMSIERGQSVDYDRHEPLTTEPDLNLPYESIKEVTRKGYEYKLHAQAFILRSAQVIVVKNN